MTGRKVRKKAKMEKREPAVVRQPVTERCSVTRAILVAALLMIIGFMVHTIEAVMTMDYYADTTYADVWSTVMMPEPGPPPIEFTYLSLVFGFVVGLIYIWAYKVVEPALATLKGYAKKGLSFGVLIFLLGVVPGSLSFYLLINLPAALIGWWTLSGLVIALVDGIIIAKFC